MATSKRLSRMRLVIWVKIRMTRMKMVMRKGKTRSCKTVEFMKEIKLIRKKN